MSAREDALREPARNESLVHAMVYVGDQLAELNKVITQYALHNDRRIETPQPAKAAPKVGTRAKPEPIEHIDLSDEEPGK